GGAGVTRGYLNRPELTAERFIADPFSGTPDARLYKTGDLGRWLPDGSLEYLGRNDFQVKLRGFRIELGEIEARLIQCSGVQEAVVIAREETSGDTRLVAYLRPQSGAELVPAELRQALSQHLAEYMLPGAFVMIDTFPLTPNGKLDRKALPAPDQQAIVSRGYEPPQGEVETRLAQIWQNLLGLERVGRHDHFFELGGHSLMVVSLIEQLRNAGWRLDVRSVFSAPVLTDMAQAIQANQGEAAFSVPPNGIPEGCTAITPEMLSLVTLSQSEIDTVVNTVAGGAANVQDIYPLAPLQEGILFHHRLQQQGDTYLLNNLIAFDTREHLDAFLGALQQVIDRHDILRTAVCWQGLTQPVQVVWRQAPLSVATFVPASADNTFANNVRAQLQAHTDPRQCHLDLSQAPLLATNIVHDPANNEWLLALNFHHLIGDHMTLELIVAEIRLLLQGQPETLPAAIPYRNFIAQTLSVPDSVHEDYFRGRLADVDAPTTPFGLLDVQGDGKDITEAHLLLDTDLAQAIRIQARRLGVSPGVLFHVAWAQVLAQTSGHDDVVFGTVLLGRLQGFTGADQVMGMFINTLPVRITLANRSVLEVVRATYRDLTSLLEHEQAPLTLAQRCSGVNPPLPLFSALFNYRHSRSDTANQIWDGMRILSAEERTNYPLDLSVDDLGEDFNLIVQSVAEVDPVRVVNYLATAISGLIEALKTEPQQPILSLPILPAAERQQLLVDFNATQTDFPQQTLIQELFEQQVKRTPDTTAVVFEDLSLSYAELNQRANQLAHALIEFGVCSDDRVAICVERSLDMMIGILGILKAGAGYVPLDPEYPNERLAHVLSDSTPKLLLTQQHLQANLPIADIPVWLLDNTKHLNSVAQQSVANPDPIKLGLQTHHLAYVIYTSGSTGLPKGVMIEHHNVVNFIHTQCQISKLKSTDRVLQFATIAFDTAVAEIFPTLSVGATLILRPAHIRIPDTTFSHFLQEQAISVADLPTAFWHQWVQEMKAGRCDFSSSLRSITVGGEKAESRHLIDWQSMPETQHCRWIDTYGPTETTVITTAMALDSGEILDTTETLSIGCPIANTHIYILNTQGQPVPLGVTGEIYIAGAGVARGYLNRPDLTDERFIADPFSVQPNARMYKTGDLGCWQPNGTIVYLGRNDFQVKIRGFRIELGEIEAQLSNCSGVKDAVVIAREENNGEKRLVAYLVPQSDATLDTATLREQLSTRLADYMLPSAFVMLEAFPLTLNGKLNRKALPAPDQSAVVTRDYESPAGELETILAQIWQNLLGLERVGRYDNFFELGGHSLLVVSLIEQLRQRNLTLDVRAVFTSPTLEAMATRMTTEATGKTALNVPPNLISSDCDAITPDMLPLVTLSQAEIDTIVKTVAGGTANVQDIYPLAPLQEGILFHHQLQEQGDVYLLNSLIAFDTRERLDAFLGALQQVIDRHDILRTAVCWQELTQPVQVVWRQAPLSVSTFVPTASGNLSADNSSADNVLADNVLAQLQAHTDPRQRQLNLNQAPLLTADIALDPVSNEWLLALSIHHLIGDHITMDLIADEIQLLLKGQAETLSVPLPYRNFIAQTLNVPSSAHETYFRSRLADIDTPTAPFGLLNVQGDGEGIIEAHLPLESALAQEIRNQARRLSISPGVLFHVAWAQVLAQTSGLKDVVFGTVLLGRLQGSAGADRVMGMFINTLPVRISLAGRSVLEVVQDTYHDLTALLEHEQAPLALAQRCSSVTPPMPLFSALLNYRHSQPDTDGAVWDGMRLLSAEERTNYPLTLSVDDFGEDFSIIVKAVATINPARIADYLAATISGLVEALTNEPQRPVLDLSILPVAERQQLLVEFNTTETDFPQETLIHELFEQQAERTPDATAVVFEDLSFSYRELNRRANRLAHHLLAIGVRPDDRVAICVERSLEMMVGLLAILKAGGAYVPLDPTYPAERLAYMLDDAAPVALLTQSALVEMLDSNLPSILLDTQLPSIFDEGSESNLDAQMLGLTPHHLAYVIYTSGSTGQPKGVMVAHKNVINLYTGLNAALTLKQPCRIAMNASIVFDASVKIWLQLLSGHTLVIVPEEIRADGQQLWRYFAHQAVDMFDCTPVQLQWLLEAGLGTISGYQPKLALIGGDAISPLVWSKLQHIKTTRFINVYGPTECTVDASICPIDISLAQPSIGRPIANTKIYILNAQGQPVPLGVIGEIYIGGVGVARGYRNRPELTAERFIPDPFSAAPHARMYKTGDLGRWLPDGNIEYLGRNDFQVKIRGFRIELGEIEAQLVQCPGVDEAVVIAREDMPGDTRLVAYLQPLTGVELVPAELRQQLTRHLAEYMIPSAFVMLETFPLTSNGKLDRKALPVPNQSAVAVRDYEAPVGEVEMALAQIWQDLLGLERVGRYDHFFELGGHSLLAVQCTTRIRQMLARDLPLAQIFARPVLIDLALALTDISVTAQTVIPAVGRDLPLPVSFAQQRLWFLDQLDPAASQAYHIPVVLRLSGKLNQQALTLALDNLVARQESLRTHFTLVDGQPCQQIDHADIGFTLSYLDLRSLSKTARTNRVAELTEYEACTPFNLTQGPLIRGQLLQLADEEHVLLFTQHHIISDGWSTGILIRELTAFYQAALTGHDVALPSLPIQYADYAVWQRGELQGDNLTKQRDFWCTQLLGAPALLELPTDRPRPSVQHYAGSLVSFHLDAGLLTALKTVGQRQDTTLFMTLLAAWAVVLARLSGQDDIVIGTPVANRTRSELEGLVGFFANTLALRIQPNQCNNVAELLTQVRERTLAAYAHQDLPFEQVVEALQPARNLSYNPIFQVMLALNNTPAQELKLPDLELTLIEQSQRSTQFDLTLSLTETDAGLVGKLEYATDLFDQETVVRMGDYFKNILTAIVTDATLAIPSLPMLSVAERQQVLVDFNATQADFPQEALIHGLFEQQAECTPDATAVVFEGQSLSYRELNRRANQLAHHLLALGVQPDDRVAICTERSLEMVIGLLGILKAGAAYLPLDPAYPAERLAYMLEDAAPVALLAQAAQVETLGCRLPVVVLDSPAASVWDNAPAENPDARALGLTSRHLAYVIYTSGSTGQPKGVMNSHRALCNRLVWMQDTYGLTPNDRVLQKTPFSFDVSVWEFFWPLLSGARLVMARPEGHKDVDYLARLIDTAGITTLHFVPSMLQQFVQGIEPRHTCAALQRVICSGEALSSELQQRFFARFSAELHNLYGPTEAAIDVTYWACQRDDQRHFVPIGRPIANTQIHILDTRGQPVPIGVTGELHIGGVGVARGYLNRPELTAERFIADPFSTASDARLYKTGDLARWLPDGSIEYLGRNDFQVKLRGFRIELGEIEARLTQCSGVQEGVVIAREDMPGDTRLVAYLRPQSGVELVPADLRQELAQHLAEYMLPSAFVMIDTFPLTPNGKLDRKALPAPDQSAVITRGYAAPVGELETTLVQIWQELLGLERVGRYDHFFELGGHSLLVVSVIERLRHVGWELDVRTVFIAPVLADLAQAIQAYQGEPAFIVPPNRIPDGCTAITPEMLPLMTLSQPEIDTIVNAVPDGVANVQDIYPLAPLQEGILFHHRLDPHRDPYVISSLLCIDNQANLETFITALQAVIDRHDILRTAIHWAGLSQPVQVVHRHAPLPVHYLTVEDGSDVVSSLQARMTLSHSYLDLSQAPLIHLQTAADPCSSKLYVLIQFHHIIDDNLSLRNFLTEMAAFLTGKGAELPPSVPYRNFVAYTRQKDNIQAAETFFREYLADLDEVTAPFGLINVQEGGEHIIEARQRLTATFSHTIRETARRLGTSPAALFHAGWALVVAHTSGRDDVVFGTTLSGRMSGMAGSASALGMFINTLPVRLKLNDISVEDLVRKANDTCASLLRYEQTPLSLVQRTSGFGNMPLFSSLLNCRHMNDIDADSPNLEQFGVTSLEGRERTNYPVGISIDDDGDSFELSAQTVNTIDPARVNAYVVRTLEQLVAILADTPSTPALDVDVLPASERQQLLVDFNATERGFPQEALIHQLFEQQAERTPDAIAVVFEEQFLSYGELNRRANRLAHHLLALGVQPDDRVAICVERSPEMVVGLLGTLKAGAAYVPLDPTYPLERLAYILDDAAPMVLLTQTSLIEKLGNSLPIVLLDAPVFDNYAENYAKNYVESNPDTQALGLTSHHLAYVIYTSGSTGQPKGVMVEHSGLRNYLQWALSHYAAAGQIDSIVSSPFAFDATVTSIYLPLLCGGKMHLIREGQELIELVPALLSTPTEPATLVKITPTHLASIGQELLAAKQACPAHCFIVGGEALPQSTLTLWRDLSPESRIINEYGPTETVVGCITFDANSQDTNNQNSNNQNSTVDSIPIGQPIANTQIYILDAQGQPVPIGVTGEIYIGGAGVARGYLNRPELTAERFISDPFSAAPDARLYKTGDLGRWLPDGNIEYLGRNDFQVKLRGFRIELGEIEARLAQCSGVQEAVVIAREDIPGDKRLVAYVQTHSGIELVPAELRRQLAQYLAEYMLPSAFVTLETFPQTPNGKLDRKALPAPEQSAVAMRGYKAPEGELETILAQIWQDLLGLERVGRHDHFFELGGHSLMAVSLIERLRNLGQTLDVRSIFSAPMLSEMALAIQSLQETPTFIAPPNRITKDCAVLTPDLLPLVILSQAEIDTIVDTVTGGTSNVQDIYPLAPLQEGILFHHRLQEQGDTYLLNNLVAFDTRERLDAFLEALQQVIDRHDILRTAVCWQGLTQPVQVVWRQAPLPVNTFVPASGDNVLAQLQAHIDPRLRRLNLNQAPLLTADIAHDPNSHEWLLALSFHHLIGDHMTLTLIVDEIRLLLQGGAEELPNSPPYRNFIAQILNVPPSVHEDYFRARLADIDAPTAPFGLLNVQGNGEDIAEVRVPLDTTLAQAIRSQARRLGISPGVLFHVAWAQVLAQTSNRDDVVFGSVLLGRLQGSASADRVMGLFINTLPIRISLADHSVLEVVQNTYRDLTTLLEHEQAPLALAQRCSGVTPPMPLFSALLNYRHSQPGVDDTAWDGMRMLVVEERNNYPLTLSVDDLGKGFNLAVQSIAGIDPTRVSAYLITAIGGLVDTLATEPQRPVLSLPILPATERQQLLVDFNATETDLPRESLLHELFEQQAARTPDATAVVFEELSLSYRELNDHANRLAHHLLTLGIQPDDRIAICVERSLDMVVGLLGILKAGAAYVPLDPVYPAERLAYMLDDASPVVLLTQTTLVETLNSNLPTVLLDAPLDNACTESNPDAQTLGL
ncbi:non-ribosomal peptide synthetase, partial [Xenorhabdus miraniensis]|uniref:non-ribosomal peptide synthetase n=1 Tax=Xenorhabdus miraniensis TaxID=351674 RepID=UPI0011AB7C72